MAFEDLIIAVLQKTRRGLREARPLHFPVAIPTATSTKGNAGVGEEGVGTRADSQCLLSKENQIEGGETGNVLHVCATLSQLPGGGGLLTQPVL